MGQNAGKEEKYTTSSAKSRLLSDCADLFSSRQGCEGYAALFSGVATPAQAAAAAATLADPKKFLLSVFHVLVVHHVVIVLVVHHVGVVVVVIVVVIVVVVAVADCVVFSAF